jgi:hypothetical protein
MTYHVCVWIDHREARVYLLLGHDDSEITKIFSESPVYHIHRKADHVGLGTLPTDPDFLADVAKALAPARAILICGPGKARTELAGYLNDHAPALGRRVWAIEPMDHPTDREMVAMARKYFRAADRMHA